jgi:Kef-type K+ transport system membrane component KefB/nucleotide-binding universal stress UspA family protein
MFWIGGFSLVAATAYAAVAPEKGGSPELLFAQIVVLILVGRLLGEAMQRIGQPAVVGQLLGGLLLGPSLFGLVLPDLQHALFPPLPAQRSMLDAISQVGILLLLLLTGMETDLRLVRKVGRSAISISIAGIIVPFAFGFALGQVMPESLLPHPEQRMIASLFLGTALSISSVKIVAMVVREMHFMRRNVGQIIVAAAITDDTVGWIIIAVTFSLATHGSLDPFSLAKSVLGTVAFMAFSLTVGRRIVFAMIRWANDHFVSEVPVISTIFVIMGAMALVTHAIGVHTVLGAFIAGVLIGESPILTRQIDEQLRGMITGFFAPVFFGISGLSADLTVLKDLNLFALTLGLILIASLGKFSGAFVGGKLGGLSGRESLALASGMNARGSTEVIVASIGLSLGMLSQNLFTMIVTMAIVTTMAMPPMLRWSLSRLPLRKEEKERLEKEEFEAKGFVTNMERVLVVVDDRPNGRFAARLAATIAGSRGMPTTVLQMTKTGRAKAAKADSVKTSAAVEAVAARAGRKKARGEGDAPDKVAVTARVQEAPLEQAISAEARRGYDLLFIGIDKAVTPKGAFADAVTRIAKSFDGPLALALARGPHAKNPFNSALNILVAVNGTEVSRRAAEVAFTLAATSTSARVEALFVSAATASNRERRSVAQTVSRAQEEAILKDSVELAERHNLKIRTAVHANVPPEEALLTEVKRGRYDLIVMGVSRRAGDKLFFGNAVQTVLAKAPCSVLLVAAEDARSKQPSASEAEESRPAT